MDYLGGLAQSHLTLKWKKMQRRWVRELKIEEDLILEFEDVGKRPEMWASKSS